MSITELKRIIRGIQVRLDQTAEKINELENMSFEIIHSLDQRILKSKQG